MKEKKTILIIDDDTDNNLLMSRIIGFMKEEPVFMLTGDKAINWISMHQPDLILCDISLPDISGIELVKTLRGIEKIAHLPVIAVSAHDYHEDIESAKNAGFTDYLVKPFMPNDLVNMIKKYLYE
ncbi:MAG TPA: response regulator [Candidatus Cloacimonadota bacterium]|nr:response regulator [Candidatus Cloacimonadota bacterium]HOD54507.1 response regulator [Candidatus Cloacimonadota bacterium]HPM01400.1 response regulator [Candidatus Cloacimonadota bacterium]